MTRVCRLCPPRNRVYSPGYFYRLCAKHQQAEDNLQINTIIEQLRSIGGNVRLQQERPLPNRFCKIHGFLDADCECARSRKPHKSIRENVPIHYGAYYGEGGNHSTYGCDAAANLMSILRDVGLHGRADIRRGWWSGARTATITVDPSHVTCPDCISRLRHCLELAEGSK